MMKSKYFLNNFKGLPQKNKKVIKEVMLITQIIKEFILMMILDKNISALKLELTLNTLTCSEGSEKLLRQGISKKKLKHLLIKPIIEQNLKGGLLKRLLNRMKNQRREISRWRPQNFSKSMLLKSLQVKNHR